jgi:hypothetical protein
MNVFDTTNTVFYSIFGNKPFEIDFVAVRQSNAQNGMDNIDLYLLKIRMKFMISKINLFEQI